MIFEDAIRMTLAQIDESMGVAYLVIRRPDGSFVRATDQAQIGGSTVAMLWNDRPGPRLPLSPSLDS